jgi:ribosomal protein S18 acetylase RimI-like enzyme
MTVTIRNATAEDAASIADIHVRTWQSAYRGLLPDDALDAITPEQRHPMWERLLAAPPGAHGVLLAERDGTLVGFSSFGRTRDPEAPDDTFELFTIYVGPEVQGQGVGTRLLQAAMAAMREAGAVGALLWVLDGNEPAQRFYRKHGWERGGSTKTETLFGVTVQELAYTIEFAREEAPGGSDTPP